MNPVPLIGFVPKMVIIALSVVPFLILGVGEFDSMGKHPQL